MATNQQNKTVPLQWYGKHCRNIKWWQVLELVINPFTHKVGSVCYQMAIWSSWTTTDSILINELHKWLSRTIEKSKRSKTHRIWNDDKFWNSLSIRSLTKSVQFVIEWPFEAVELPPTHFLLMNLPKGYQDQLENTSNMKLSSLWLGIHW